MKSLVKLLKSQFYKVGKIAPGRKTKPHKSAAGRRRSTSNPKDTVEKDAAARSPQERPLHGAQSKSAKGRPAREPLLKTPARRFWILGVLAVVLLYHSYGILFGNFWSISMVSYDQAIGIGVLEALLVPFLSVIFLWKTIVWLHDRPYTLKHVFDDPGILD